MESLQIIWSDSFKVGHAQLDEEHKRFVELINTVYIAGSSRWARNEMNPLLDGLVFLADQHFKHENSVLMAINKSPIPSGVNKSAFILATAAAAIDKHIASHAKIRPRLGVIVKNIRSELRDAKPKLSSELKDWFIDHATKYDAYLKPIFELLNKQVQ
jgi:hemerythrin